MLPGDGGPAGRQVPAGLASACMGQMGHEISTQFRFHGAPVNAPVKIYFCIGDYHAAHFQTCCFRGRFTPVL
jgi:hypothetical protein